LLIVVSREGGQAPAPASEFTGDGDTGDGGAFAAGIEPLPAVVQPPVAGLSAGTYGGWLAVLTPGQLAADPVSLAVVPGGLDQ